MSNGKSIQGEPNNIIINQLEYPWSRTRHSDAQVAPNSGRNSVESAVSLKSDSLANHTPVNITLKKENRYLLPQ